MGHRHNHAAASSQGPCRLNLTTRTARGASSGVAGCVGKDGPAASRLTHRDNLAPDILQVTSKDLHVLRARSAGIQNKQLV